MSIARGSRVIAIALVPDGWMTLCLALFYVMENEKARCVCGGDTRLLLADIRSGKLLGLVLVLLGGFIPYAHWCQFWTSTGD